MIQFAELLTMKELARRHIPKYWRVRRSAEVVEEELSDYEDLDIIDMMPYDLDITSVVKVKNPYLWSCYQLKKAEYRKRYGHVSEVTLYHATAEDNVQSIISENFDWRFSVRTKFGRGVSFSPDPKYANRHCNSNAGCARAMIVASVLVSNKCQGSYSTKIPTKGCDTTVGNKDKVYVKYSDNEFYPEYVIYYNDDSELY
ncbi:protein mono-ADP-ribosyltransferase TIPARP-like isoform X2 [Schistocerca piceifrons]|uniref:protein mono-ADP-ribosyltransferase TIPARP-like isoform X2 n=1 Tax=Schistocerca piceifrons TaxID=274613 RepID=UPI001F5FDB31|nr:protein mono-ADP-ribosyltransferase TIPARP-like isoform X2 [Schistocerca piceifrons]